MTLKEYIEAKNAKAKAWVAEDPENRWAGTLTEDLAHWAEYGVTTAEGLERYLLVGEIWDSYKDLNGIRPRWMNFNEMSLDELRKEAESLCKEAESLIEEDLRKEREEEERKARLLAPAPEITLGDFF